MQQWVQLVRSQPCGRCGQMLPAQTTALEIALPSVKAKKIRCPGCAGRPVPCLEAIRLIAPAVTVQDIKDRFTHVASLAQQFPRQQPKARPKPMLVQPKRAYRGEPEDYKVRQAGMLDELPRYDR